MKPCQFCSELIPDEAQKCRFCASWLVAPAAASAPPVPPPVTAEKRPRSRSSKLRIGAAIIGVLLISLAASFLVGLLERRRPAKEQAATAAPATPDPADPRKTPEALVTFTVSRLNDGSVSRLEPLLDSTVFTEIAKNCSAVERCKESKNPQFCYQVNYPAEILPACAPEKMKPHFFEALGWIKELGRTPCRSDAVDVLSPGRAEATIVCGGIRSGIVMTFEQASNGWSIHAQFGQLPLSEIQLDVEQRNLARLLKSDSAP